MKRILFFFIAIILLFAPFVTARAISYVTKAYVTVTVPKVGAVPVNKGTVPSSASTYVSKVEWSGNLDENGCFKAGEAYTAKVYLNMKSGMDKIFRVSPTSEWKINGRTATYKAVQSSAGKKCILECTFPRIGMSSKIITSAAITFPEPVPGQKPATTATVTGASEVEVVKMNWTGTLDQDGSFKPDVNYQLTIHLGIKSGCLGSFSMQNENNSFTLNGKPKKLSKVQGTSAQMAYHVRLEPTLDYLDLSKLYSQEQADASYPPYHPLVFNMAKQFIWQQEKLCEGDPDAGKMNRFIDYHLQKLSKEERLRVQKVVVNIPDKTSWMFMFDMLPNIREVWFGENSDPFSVLTAFVDNRSNDDMLRTGSQGGTTSEMAIYLPASKYPKGLLSIQEQNKGQLLWLRGIPAPNLRFRTYVYTGNMYEAMQNQEAACKRYCPGHDFSAKVAAAHTVMRHSSCSHNSLFYYSCKYCGECEHNPKHTFMDLDPKVKTYPLPHTYVRYDLSDKNYVGRNAKGEKVYMKSCYWCGLNGREEVERFTQADLVKSFGPNPEMTLAQYKETMLKAWDNVYRKKGLETTYAGHDTPRYFAVSEDDHGAKTSPAARNETKWAMVLNLIDKDVLGTDYLKSITRLQMASLAVKLVEQLSQKELTPAPSGTYSDTDNIYALKANEAGIMAAKKADKFAPTAVVSRQEMATVIYNALQYVRNNTSIRYTIYTPDLDRYADKAQIAPETLKAMGFTHKLGIIKETGKTTLEPLKDCLIEDAVIAAYRGYFADELGWYQCVGPKERGYAGSDGGWGAKYVRSQPENNGQIILRNYENGDRIWVSEPWIERDQFRKRRSIIPFTDEYTGTTVFVSAQDFLPVKDL